MILINFFKKLFYSFNNHHPDTVAVPLFKSSLSKNFKLNYTTATESFITQIERHSPKELDMRWTDVPLLNRELAKELAVPKKPTQTLEEFGIRLVDPETLIICEMGFNSGRCVKTIQAIKKNTIICLYAGVIWKTKKFFPIYGEHLTLRTMSHGNNIETEFITSCEAIDSFGSLIQHAPASEQLEPYGKKNIATANLQQKYYLFGTITFIALEAIENIEAGNILTINYGEKYWQNYQNIAEQNGELINICFFTPQGEILGNTHDINIKPLCFSTESVETCKKILAAIDLAMISRENIQNKIQKLAVILALKHKDILNFFTHEEKQNIIQLADLLKHYADEFYRELYSSAKNYNVATLTIFGQKLSAIYHLDHLKN